MTGFHRGGFTQIYADGETRIYWDLSWTFWILSVETPAMEECKKLSSPLINHYAVLFSNPGQTISRPTSQMLRAGSFHIVKFKILYGGI
jgi:hypothetical protein